MTPKNMSYSEAVARIEEILQQVETGELDVDELAAKVKLASELLKVCKGKLFSTEKEVEKILKEMEGGEEGRVTRDE
jgi:exodeoxyribonuclease VII small subunit